MIPLGKQVTSLELSKRLKELGVKQDSLYYWVQGGLYPDDWSESTLESEKQIKKCDNDFVCSAFTVAELSLALPASIKTDYGSLNYLHITKLGNIKEWLIAYHYVETKGNTLANACAKMRIYLIENKLVEVK